MWIAAATVVTVFEMMQISQPNPPSRPSAAQLLVYREK